MSKDSPKQFTFRAYKYKLSGPLLNNDTNVTFIIDQAERINLAPFILFDADATLEITVKQIV